MEGKCYVGSSPQVTGYQAGTTGGNRGAETKLPKRAKKGVKNVGN